MNKLFFIISLFALTFSPHVRAEVQIISDPDVSLDLTLLRETSEKSFALLEASFGKLKKPIKIHVASKACVHVGFDFPSKQFTFCPGEKVIQSGVASVDVIRHELFHAFLCVKNPALCAPEALKNEEITALHEGLADFFAYAMEPDEGFGRNFYTGEKYIRPYQSDQCFSLAEGSHAKGTSLVTKLLSLNLSQMNVAKFLGKNDFTIKALLEDRGGPCFAGEAAPHFDFGPENYPFSKLRRYWIQKDKPLFLLAQPDAAFRKNYPEFNVKWGNQTGEDSELFEISPHDNRPLNFVVKAGTEPGSEKLTAVLVTPDHKTIGSRTFYFGIRKRP